MTRAKPSAGAHYSRGRGVEFRVWAPEHTRIELQLSDCAQRVALEPQPDAPDFFSRVIAQAAPGTRYCYFVDGHGPYADPRSRFQPDGPGQASEVIAPDEFAWSDADWKGSALRGQILYELHVGTFSESGTWLGARHKLPQLHELGVSCIELMPIADFPGNFGWGYDGVALYAPHARYGRPDEMRAFVDTAHQLGIGVILDVVYNHLGPAHSVLSEFSKHYLSERQTEWGAALNFDGPHCRPVRDFVCENAEYWIREFHLDGFRLDATQCLFDDSDEHILTELARRARAAASGRDIILIAENEPQQAKLARAPEHGGCGLDGLWNDDFHHSAVVALTGRREAYYTDYLGRAQEFVAAAKFGFLYQGQRYVWQNQRRGTPTRDLPPHKFIAYLENHDQVANSPAGERLSTQASPANYRAMTSLLLLGPWTPLLFQGQEWGSTRPFAYFADHAASVSGKVHSGRRASLAQFPSFATVPVQERMPDPGARSTFESARLDWGAERSSPRGQYHLALHRDLLQLRKSDPILGPGARQDLQDVRLDGAALNERALCLRWFTRAGRDRLLIVNFGPELRFEPAPEPLLAPPEGAAWQLVWSSEDPRYGGYGQPAWPSDAAGFSIPACSALFFAPGKREPA